MTVDLKKKSLSELVALHHAALGRSIERSKDKSHSAKTFLSARFTLTKKLQTARGKDREVLLARLDKLDTLAAASAQEHGQKQAAALRTLDTIGRAMDAKTLPAPSPKLQEPSARGVFRPGR